MQPRPPRLREFLQEAFLTRIFLKSSCFLRRRLLLPERNEEAEHGAEGGGADPAHHHAVKGNVLREQSVKRCRTQACSVQRIGQRKNEREENGALIYAAAPADEAVEKREQDKDDDQRVDRYKERHGKRDDLRKTDVRCAEAEEDGEEQQSLIGNLLFEELMEEHRSTRSDTAARRDAREDDDQREEHVARRAEEQAHGSGKELSAVFRVAKNRHARRPKIRQRAVNARHKEYGDKARRKARLADGMRICHAAIAHSADDERTDGDGREKIHCLVAVLKALRVRRVDVGSRSFEHIAQRRAECAQEEDHEHDEKRRREHLAHSIDKLVRIERQVI